MLIIAVAVTAAAVAQQPAPKRDVRDPGVVATGQRITPAGVQTVFDGRVGGVRFGETSDEIWAAVPGFVYRLDWRANSVRARARVDGRTGIYSLAVDPTTHRVLATSVGRLPVTGAAANARRPSVAQLSIFDAKASGDSAAAKFNSGSLGDYMAGAPAVAARAGADGRRLAVVPLPANDALAVLDAETGALHSHDSARRRADRRRHLRRLARGVRLRARRTEADALDSAQRCNAAMPRAEPVRVDARGIALAGSVSRVDLATGAVTRDIAVGRHPTALAWDEAGARLYVADGQFGLRDHHRHEADTVVVDIAIAPFRERKTGLAPTALALAPDRPHALRRARRRERRRDVRRHARIFRAPTLEGLIPTAWYPSSIDVERRRAISRGRLAASAWAPAKDQPGASVRATSSRSADR